MLIDIHAHYSPRRYAELQSRLGRPRLAGFSYAQQGTVPQPYSDSPADIEARLKLMDDAGVDMQVLSAAASPPYSNDEAIAVEAAHLCNDTYNELVKRYPERFAAFGSLPMPNVAASIREIGRCLDDLGMVGFTMTCSCLDQSSAAEELEPIYAELDRRGAVLFYHPSGNGLCSPLLTDYRFNFAAGAPMEDTTIVAQLIARHIPYRYPNIKFVVPHFGGALPLLVNRLDHEAPPVHPDLPEPPSATLRRLYYDTVGHGSQVALWAAWKEWGADHLIAGSDYPIMLAFEPYARTFEYIRESTLPPEDIDKILNRNAAKLLGIKDKHPV